MKENILDASPNKSKNRFFVPTSQPERQKFYLDLIEKYQAANPVKFESKREELQKKAEGYIYTYNPKTNRTEWVLVYPLKGAPEITFPEPKKTPVEKDAELELGALKARVAELEAKEEKVEEVEKPKVSKTKKGK